MVRARAVFALNQIVDWESREHREKIPDETKGAVVRAFIDRLGDSHPDVREEVARALMVSVGPGDNSITSIIIAALESQPRGDRYEGVRYLLRQALKHIGTKEAMVAYEHWEMIDW